MDAPGAPASLRMLLVVPRLWSDRTSQQGGGDKGVQLQLFHSIISTVVQLVAIKLHHFTLTLEFKEICYGQECTQTKKAQIAQINISIHSLFH